MEIGRESLVAIVGQVGSGKSSVISALLGEMQKQHGTVTVNVSTFASVWWPIAAIKLFEMVKAKVKIKLKIKCNSNQK